MTEDALQTFSLRHNAIRKAKQLIAVGQAPSNEYTVEAAGDGFAIYWKVSASPEALETAAGDLSPVEAEATRVAKGGAVPLEDIEAVVADDPAAVKDNPFPDGSLVIARGDGHAGWQPAMVLSRRETDGGAYWRVQFADRSWAGLRQEPDMKIISADRHAALVAEIEVKKAGLAKPAKPERDSGSAPSTKSSGRPRSTKQAAAAASAAALGEMPARPEIASPTNQHYVPRFKKLEALAVAGDWAAVEAFPVKGKNTYAKKLIRYRDELVQAHRAQQSKMEVA